MKIRVICGESFLVRYLIKESDIRSKAPLPSDSRHRIRHDFPVFQMDGAVGDGGQTFVVGHDDECLPQAVAQVEEELVQLGLVVGIEAARGLVGQHDGRSVDEGTRHGHTLLLAARKFVGLVRGTVGKAHHRQYLEGGSLGFVPPLPGNEGGYHDILQGRKLGQELMKLEDKTDAAVAEGGELTLLQPINTHAVDADCTRIGAVEGTHNLKQGGLAGTAGADDAHHFALLYLEVDATQHLQAAEALGYQQPKTAGM